MKAHARHVLVNDRVLLLQKTGVGHYVQQLLRALHDLKTNSDMADADPLMVRGFFSALSSRWLESHEVGADQAPSSGGDRPTSAPSATQRAGIGRRVKALLRPCLQAAYGLAFRARAAGFDLVHEPNHIPIATRRPTITTIHDLSVLVHPAWHPADRVRWYERAFARGVSQSVRFIAASQFTRAEMVRVLGLPVDRIDVTYQAARPGFTPRSPEVVATTRAHFGLPERFLLFVGTLEPRKNLVGLLEAYACLPAFVRAKTPLAIAGGWGWNTDEIESRLRAFDLTRSVRLLGYVHDATLAALYSGCRALVWPSLYEGFGLPPLEALACGAAVAVSNAASLPEVVGEAAVQLPPHDTTAWSETLRRLIEDESWRAALAARGPAQAARFSWRRCAAETLAAYRRALS